MRHWSALVLFVLSFFYCCDLLEATPVVEDERPNILWLTIEDVGPELGCYGDSHANTPALDAFAKDSLRYTTAWSTYPVCAPARTTIISGRYASSMAAGNMRSEVPLPKGTVMFPSLLRKAGYYCSNRTKEDYNLTKPAGVWDESGGKAHYSNRKPGQPFFAVFNHTKTHESKIRKRPHDAVTDPAKLTLPPFWPDLPEIREDLGQYYDNIHNMDKWFQKQLDELERSGEKENTIVFFYGDHGSGMPRFKRYAGNTGYHVAMMVHVPEKFRGWATDYEAGQESNRLVSFVDLAPTVLSLCSIEPPASMEGRAWFGPHKKPGDEFLFGFRERMDEWVDLSHCVRDKRFQYAANYMPHLPAGQPLAYQMQTPATKKWLETFERGEATVAQSEFWMPRSAEELYDIQADPYGMNNLANDPAYAKQLASFREAHRTQALKTSDWSFVPEPISVARVGMRETEEGREFTRVAFEAAQVAALQSADSASDQQVLAMLGDENAAVRYWGTVGIQQRLDRMKDSAPELERLLEDKEEVVQVAAAEALCRLERAPADLKASSIKRLLYCADQSNTNYLVAVAALNALDRQRNLLDAQAIDYISSLPDKAVGRRRGIDDLEKLKARFQQAQ
jgi:uncharacterized sulfatase